MGITRTFDVAKLGLHKKLLSMDCLLYITYLLFGTEIWLIDGLLVNETCKQQL